MSGSQEVQGATIVGDLQQIEKVRLERTIMEVYSKALKRAQDLAAEKMKEVTGFNLPGLV
jgi:DNA-binding protein YbaB